jgi:GH43 family beta-xylosidase
LLLNKTKLNAALQAWLNKKPKTSLNTFKLDSTTTFTYEVDSFGLKSQKDLNENGFKKFMI